MKKLITLSAIALAGGTLGVGSAFGWWGDDPPPIKSEAKELIIETTTAPRVEVIDEVRETQIAPPIKAPGLTGESIDLIGDLQPTQSRVILIADPTPDSAAVKLADQLDAEAKELETRGEKEAAQIQRKVAQRLREAFLKSTPKSARIVTSKPHNLEVEVKLSDKTEGEKKDLHQYLKDLHSMLQKTADPVAREKLHAEIRNQEAKLKQSGTPPVDPKDHHVEVREPKQVQGYRVIVNKDGKTFAFAHAGDPREIPAHVGRPDGMILQHLVEVAERLEKEGHKEAAQSIREHAGQIKKNVAVAQEHVKAVRAAAEAAERKKAHAEAYEAWVRHNEAGPHKPGHPGDIQELLQDLRREIGQLREEVRDLRGMINREHPDEDRIRSREIKKSDAELKGDRATEEVHRMRKALGILRAEEAKSQDRKESDKENWKSKPKPDEIKSKGDLKDAKVTDKIRDLDRIKSKIREELEQQIEKKSKLSEDKLNIEKIKDRAADLEPTKTRKPTEDQLLPSKIKKEGDDDQKPRKVKKYPEEGSKSGKVTKSDDDDVKPTKDKSDDDDEPKDDAKRKKGEEDDDDDQQGDEDAAAENESVFQFFVGFTR